MALWHFMQGDQSFSWMEGGAPVSSFDDGLDLVPGEAGFSSSVADSKAAGFGADPSVTAIYTGTPGYAARIDREEAAALEAEKAAAEAKAATNAKAAADAAIDAMLNPVSPEDAQRAAINAHFDALLAAAPDRAADIATLRAIALDALATE